MINEDERLIRQNIEAAQIRSAILTSKSKLKLIVAGAGTGKSSIFKGLFLQQPGKYLAFTLTKALVVELQKCFGEQQNIAFTFHSFSLSVLSKGGQWGRRVVFPKLGDLIARDALYLEACSCAKDCFSSLFRSLNENDPKVNFFLSRADFYQATSFDDATYRALTYFRENPDSLPVFDQVLVDEYQDFSALEVELIRLLSSRSPTLFAGDDDQSIYRFRDAKPEFIRGLAAHPDIARFELPFCYRCTSVLVAAANCVIGRATRLGFLKGRIDKRYESSLAVKREDSRKHPKIVCASTTGATAKSSIEGRYIEKTICQNLSSFRKDQDYPFVLVAAPFPALLSPVKKHILKVFPEALIIEPEAKVQPFTTQRAYELLRSDNRSNLGWRILICSEDEEKQRDWIRAAEDRHSPLIDAIDPAFVESHLRCINEVAGKIVTETDEQREKVGFRIQFSTFQGCKGLSADFVFALGFGEGKFPKNNSQPTDAEICTFLVLLTRARKQFHSVRHERSAP